MAPRFEEEDEEKQEAHGERDASVPSGGREELVSEDEAGGNDVQWRRGNGGGRLWLGAGAGGGWGHRATGQLRATGSRQQSCGRPHLQRAPFSRRVEPRSNPSQQEKSGSLATPGAASSCVTPAGLAEAGAAVSARHRAGGPQQPATYGRHPSGPAVGVVATERHRQGGAATERHRGGPSGAVDVGGGERRGGGLRGPQRRAPWQQTEGREFKCCSQKYGPFPFFILYISNIPEPIYLVLATNKNQTVEICSPGQISNENFFK